LAVLDLAAVADFAGVSDFASTEDLAAAARFAAVLDSAPVPGFAGVLLAGVLLADAFFAARDVVGASAGTGGSALRRRPAGLWSSSIRKSVIPDEHGHLRTRTGKGRRVARRPSFTLANQLGGA
jgi:hypothetical protein